MMECRRSGRRGDRSGVRGDWGAACDFRVGGCASERTVAWSWGTAVCPGSAGWGWCTSNWVSSWALPSAAEA